MPETTYYFELNGDAGLAPAHLRKPDGTEVPNPAAGAPEEISRPVPLVVGQWVQVGKDTVPTTTQVSIDPIGDTRIVSTSDALIANAMRGHPLFHEIEPPSKKDLEAAVKVTADARAARAAINAAPTGEKED